MTAVEGLGQARGVVLVGVDGHVVDVEAHVYQGVVGFTVVGLADRSVGEARDRARSALLNSGLPWPALRITIGLSPASIPKRGSTLDLPIALAIAVSQGAVPQEALREHVVLGELGLDGRLRPVRGVLVAALATRRAGIGALVVPAANADEARLVGGLRVLPFTTLAGLAAHLRGEPPPEVELDTPDVVLPPPRRPVVPDLRDVRGQREARAAIELAAAGGHHVAMVGPPGVGKTLLAERLPGILPALGDDEALEVTAVHSVAGLLRAGQLVRTPPFVAPHHTATYAAMVGGGSSTATIGQISLAHHGVLFMDEAPHFDSATMDALRQPLEKGQITVTRAAFAVRYPARFQLVLAMNPCPCGKDDGSTLGGSRCACTSVQRRRYLTRISGPLLDRVDVRITLGRPSVADLGAAPAEGTAEVAARVLEARSRAARRFAGTSWSVNGHVPGPELRKRYPLAAEAAAPIERAVTRGLLSARGADRVARVAWTVADLSGHDRPTLDDVGTALAFREPGHEAAA